MKRIMCALILVVMAAASARAGHPIDSAIAAIRNTGVWIDKRRCPDTTIFLLGNRVAKDISLEALSNEKMLTYPCSSGVWKMALPSNFYRAKAVLINPMPDQEESSVNKRYVLTYCTPEEFGKIVTYTTARPELWTVFADTLMIAPAPTLDDQDTLLIQFYATAETPDSMADTVDLPDRYMGLWEERVKLLIMERIEYVGPSREASKVREAELESTLLGRPSDEE